ncbi:MarR family winged helix-turn-helix transcriptional regulator [Micromonospora olivasterospora]|uniref:DNA-binding MarR family transcriptional regulator n=1 Tax=Micromonospora olivasterospora TaxID=1880 RepID=A0A562IH96_MICOL|nr:MarR family winged helix-turn-helix transcriptional regulator [Micromonospora olivasterospora]TWH70113.1 DNA-binding MarR family transcriptional regulator [Micromonospora olivasterospora]
MEPARELGVRLHELTTAVRMIKQRYADSRSSVPLGMIGLLRRIDRFGDGCHARELALRAGLDPSTVSRAVAGLVAQGLVERRTDAADKRVAVLAVTPAGRAALADTENWYGAVLDRALTGWTPAEAAALSAALARFTHDIKNALGNQENLEAAR